MSVTVRRRQAKLTEDNVRYILELLNAGGHTHQQIADMFHVSKSVISSIKKGRTWKDVSFSGQADLTSVSSRVFKCKLHLELTFEVFSVDNIVLVDCKCLR